MPKTAAAPGYDVYEGRANRPPTPATDLRDEQLRLALAAQWLTQPRRNELTAECEFRGIEPPTRTEPMPARDLREEAARRLERKRSYRAVGIELPPDRHDAARDRQPEPTPPTPPSEWTSDELFNRLEVNLPDYNRAILAEIRSRYDEYRNAEVYDN